ncbi:Z-ring formation inhibitor MciZ [Paenibacillus hodogayensis]|uniref:Z-ring formation inhibitor MciZ n=1 Tax=Paenibacillus hodogayensis TaxID=279208 RepID=A0ABV5W511_9BACL
MKSYITETQLRLVGKSWEIRAQLRSMSAAAGSGQDGLAALLPKLIDGRQQPTERPAPPRIPSGKTPDRRVVAFPSS